MPPESSARPLIPSVARGYKPPPRGDGAIAQLVERLNGIQEVSGSTPLGSTTPLHGISPGKVVFCLT